MSTLAALPIEIQPHEVHDQSISIPGFPVRMHHQWIYRFPNSYGASVVRGDNTYGSEEGLFEVAVLKFDGDESRLDYETPITARVLGWQSIEDVASVLMRIAGLPS